MSTDNYSQSAEVTLLNVLADCEATLRNHSRNAEAERCLPDGVVEPLREAGFYRLFRPAELGGFGLHPVSEFRVAEALAKIDGAYAWNVQVCNASDLYGGWFSESGVNEVFGQPRAIVGGSFNPPRRAEPVDGGFIVSGVTPFNSNCLAADWTLGLAQIEDGNGGGTMLLTATPMSEARIIPNWETMGLCATGSHDVELDRVFVPADRAVPFTPAVDPPARYDNALTRMAIWITAGAHASVALGIARSAIDDLVELGSKVPAYTGDSIRDRSRVQFDIAKAEGLLASARGYFFDAFDEAYRSAETKGQLTLREKANCQLACTNAVSAAAAAVDRVHQCAGTSGIRKEKSFEKYFRDVHVITQHAFVSEARLEAVGQALFGTQPDWPFFSF